MKETMKMILEHRQLEDGEKVENDENIALMMTVDSMKVMMETTMQCIAIISHWFASLIVSTLLCSALLWCDRCDTMSWHCDVKLRLISDKISRTYCVAASPADPLGHNFKIDFWPPTLYNASTNDAINCLFRLTTPKDFLKTNVQCTLYIPLIHAQKMQHRRWDVSSWWTGLF